MVHSPDLRRRYAFDTTTEHASQMTLLRYKAVLCLEHIVRQAETLAKDTKGTNVDMFLEARACSHARHALQDSDDAREFAGAVERQIQQLRQQLSVWDPGSSSFCMDPLLAMTMNV